jgi:AcrR family transcriptional regulator
MSFASPPEVTPATPRRRTARREATRLRILSAAEDVFAERGFHGASVEDICERAEFTRGAFYSNFASKDELVLELFQQHVAGLQAAIAEVASRPGLPLAEVFEAVFDVWTGEPEARRRWYLLTGEFALHALRDKDVQQAWIAVQGEVRRELAALVDQIAAAHGVAATIPTENFVRIVTAVFQGGLGQHLLDPQTVPAGSLEREFLPLLVAAVSTPAEGPTTPR